MGWVGLVLDKLQVLEISPCLEGPVFSPAQRRPRQLRRCFQFCRQRKPQKLWRPSSHPELTYWTRGRGGKSLWGPGWREAEHRAFMKQVLSAAFLHLWCDPPGGSDPPFTGLAYLISCIPDTCITVHNSRKLYSYDVATK